MHEGRKHGVPTADQVSDDTGHLTGPAVQRTDGLAGAKLDGRLAEQGQLPCADGIQGRREVDGDLAEPELFVGGVACLTQPHPLLSGQLLGGVHRKALPQRRGCPAKQLLQARQHIRRDDERRVGATDLRV